MAFWHSAELGTCWAAKIPCRVQGYNHPIGQTLYFAAVVYILFFLSFFLTYSQRSQTLAVHHTSTHDAALVLL